MSNPVRRVSSHPLSRRRLIGGSTALGAAVLFGAGCGSDDDDDEATPTPTTGSGATPTSEAPVSGGTLNLHITSDPANFDYQQALTAPVVYTLYGNRLLNYKTGSDVSPNAYELQGDLADSWEEQDDQTITFKLNPGAAFHDIDPVNGRTLTSTDVKETLTHLATPEAGYLFGYLANYIDRIDTPEDHTVVLNLKAPTPLVYTYLAYYNAAIAPAEIYVRDGNLAKNTIGSGPFQATRLEKGVAYEFAKNPNYFRSGLPRLDGVNISVLPDANAALDAFRTGRLDALDVGFELLENARQTLPKASTTLTTVPGIGWFAPWFNVTKPPFDDLRVRQAFSLAIDRTAINTLVSRGDGEIRTGPISRGWDWSRNDNAVAASAKRDVTRAKQLLDSAGHTDGLDVTFMAINSHLAGASGNLVQVLQEQLKDAGIRLTIEQVERSAAIERFGKLDYTLGNWSIRAYPDPDDYLAPFFLPGGSKNFGGTDDRALTALIEKSQQATNTEERKAVLQEIDQRWTEDFLYALFTVELPFTHAHQNTLGNYAGRNPSDYANLEGAFKKA